MRFHNLKTNHMFILLMRKISLIAILIIFLSLSILLMASAVQNKNVINFIISCILISIGILIGIKKLIKD
jgi:uncharacterized membrane protein YqjE